MFHVRPSRPECPMFPPLAVGDRSDANGPVKGRDFVCRPNLFEPGNFVSFEPPLGPLALRNQCPSDRLHLHAFHFYTLLCKCSDFGFGCRFWLVPRGDHQQLVLGHHTSLTIPRLLLKSLEQTVRREPEGRTAVGKHGMHHFSDCNGSVFSLGIPVPRQ